MTTEEQHHTKVVIGQAKREMAGQVVQSWLTYTPSCSCGYIGPVFNDKGEAQDDADDHTLAVTS
jgi:hypothetical protein